MLDQQQKQDDPPWMAIARRELGTKERVGPADNPRVVEYLAATHLPTAMQHDETPWCASFVTWCLEQAGIASTRSAAARSYLDWGEHLDAPRNGCVAVLSRFADGQPGAGHVGFWSGSDGDGHLLLLGGNQANEVCVRWYPEARVLGYRWPRAA